MFSLWKLAYRPQEDAEKHFHLLRENSRLISDADALIGKKATASAESADWFLQMSERVEEEDRSILGEPKPRAKTSAYREALKELGCVCPHCHASPYEYLPGSCQLCGNRPQSERKEEDKK